MLSERELQGSLNGRRSFLKMLAAAPLFATIGTRKLAATVKSTVSSSFTDNVYTRVGVRPLINGRGTWTYLCGSLELPEARRAAEEASHYFVDLFELQAGVGRHLAKLAGANLQWSRPAQPGRWLRRLRAPLPGQTPKMSGNCPTQPV